MAAEYLLTTIDNPFDPFADFDNWYLFDMEKGYNTCAYIDRVIHDAPDLSDEEYDEEYNHAIDQILRYDPTGLYLRVEKGKFKKPETSDLSKLLPQ